MKIVHRRLLLTKGFLFLQLFLVGKNLVFGKKNTVSEESLIISLINALRIINKLFFKRSQIYLNKWVNIFTTITCTFASLHKIH